MHNLVEIIFFSPPRFTITRETLMWLCLVLPWMNHIAPIPTNWLTKRIHVEMASSSSTLIR